MGPGQINERIMCTSGTEGQAAKRQKLEGGHLFKVNTKIFSPFPLFCLNFCHIHKFWYMNYCYLGMLEFINTPSGQLPN